MSNQPILLRILAEMENVVYLENRNNFGQTIDTMGGV